MVMAAVRAEDVIPARSAPLVDQRQLVRE